jgi:hypothetical protein
MGVDDQDGAGSIVETESLKYDAEDEFGKTTCVAISSVSFPILCTVYCLALVFAAAPLSETLVTFSNKEKRCLRPRLEAWPEVTTYFTLVTRKL